MYCVDDVYLQYIVSSNGLYILMLCLYTILYYSTPTGGRSGPTQVAGLVQALSGHPAAQQGHLRRAFQVLQRP